MYKTTKSKQDEIVKLYKEGVMLTEICKLTSSSQLTVKKALAFFGINYDQERKDAYSKKLDLLVELYKQGKSQNELEKELGLTRKTIRTVLKSHDLKYRSKSEQQHIRCNTEIDEHCFDELTPEALYWIGMLYTDGHVTKTGDYSICLTQHDYDIEHLEKFKSFLKTNRLIKADHGDCSRLRFNSKILYNRLKELGLNHDKSYTAKPHELLKNSRDFWRGVVDGDGGLYDYTTQNKSYKTSKHLTLCGTLETIFEFIIFCNKEANVKEKYPTQNSGKALYSVSYYGEDAIKVSTLLYKDSQVHLDRKYEQFKEFII
jgi:hypothetical protein